jgi:hypothetical protein
MVKYPGIAGEALTAPNDAGVLYIGLGDQFDDDRRLVRAMAPALRATQRQFRTQRDVIGFVRNK